jgi:uncharacterized membrane protein YedE/YeeE
MTEYWSWWQGALALGGLTVVFVLMLGRMLGVSGSWANVVGWREARRREKTAAAFQSKPAVMQNALLAATLAEFGEQQTAQALAGQGQAPSASAPKKVQAAASLRWTAQLTFLLSMMLGGFLAAISTGHFEIRFDLGSAHTQLFGSDWRVWVTLVAGGTLVGFGTQMGGGCTSGHGLSGTSRLTPASLLATAMFFGSAVAISFILEAYLK